MSHTVIVGGKTISIVHPNSSVVIPPPPESYWISTLDGSGTDIGYSITADSSNNVYTLGRTTSEGFNGDISLSKRNAIGALQWQRRFGGLQSDGSLSFITVDNSNNLYLCTETYSYTSGKNDILVLKYNPDGILQWHINLGTSYDESGSGITTDATGNVYVCGELKMIAGSSTSNGFVVKLNSSGVIQWQKVVSDAFGAAKSIIVDSLDNLYVWTHQSGMASLTKYNTSGTALWQKTLSSIVARGSISVDSSNAIYVCGYTSSSGQGSNDLFFAKYNTSGAILWQKTLGGAGSELCNGIVTDASGNFYLCGNTASEGQGSNDAIIAKGDGSNGTISWQRTLGDTNSNVAYGVYIDSSGDLLLAVSSGSDSLTARLPSDGSLTGVYDGLTYAESTLVLGTSSFTEATVTASSTNSALVSSVPPLNTGVSAGWKSKISVHDSSGANLLSVDSLGNIYSASRRSSAGITTKRDSSGNSIWQKTFGGTHYGSTVDSSDNVYSVGFLSGEGAGGNELSIIKRNSSGTLAWKKRLGGTGLNDVGYGVVADSSGNVYVAGRTDSGGAGSLDGILVKYDSAGNSIWRRVMGGTGFDQAQDVGIDSVGNVYVCGRYFNGTTTVTFLAKYNSSGTNQWQKYLGNTESVIAESMKIDSSDNIYIAGGTRDGGALRDFMFLAKYNTSGTRLWQRKIGDNFTNMVCKGIDVDSSGNIYIGGTIVIAKYNSSGTLQWQKNSMNDTTNQSIDGLVISGLYLYYSIQGNSVYKTLLTGEHLPDMSLTASNAGMAQGTSALTLGSITLTAANSNQADTLITDSIVIDTFDYGVVETSTSLTDTVTAVV